MQWLNTIVEELIAHHHADTILVESGGSPSGTYHLGHLRELVICDAIVLELKKRGYAAEHVYFVDDLDALRKIPLNIPEDFSQYLGMPLCDVPAPDGSDQSYADYFLAGLQKACTDLGIELTFMRSHEKYRSGFFVPVIERCLARLEVIRAALADISNRQLPDDWTPIQVMDNGRLKNRKFVNIDEADKTIVYENNEGIAKSVQYDKGEVKLDWRLDWPGRWWLMGVDVEPFGREHASAGGSYDTGVRMMKDVYEARAPLPVPYDSIHMVGDTKKMSASKGTAVSANEGLQLLPSEVIRFFMLRSALNRPVYFDPVNGVVQLIDDFAALAAKSERSESEEQLYFICTGGIDKRTISSIPFSLLVASYQAALMNKDRTVEILGRTEYASVVRDDAEIIKNELTFIDTWLSKQAPEDVKFSLNDSIDASVFNEKEKLFLSQLADAITKAPEDADGNWFHQVIYSQKDSTGMEPKDMFRTLYRVLIGKDSGPRAGWFLSILPRDWLIQRLRLEA